MKSSHGYSHPRAGWNRILLIYLGTFLSGTVATVVNAEFPLLGGGTTIVLPPSQGGDRDAFGYPAPNLSLTRRDDHFVGNSFFEGIWVTAPASTTARDGLGPLFNTMSCQSCHAKDGRGRPPKRNEDVLSMLARISVPEPANEADRARRDEVGVYPHAVYGTQIQDHGIVGVAREARLEIEWEDTRHQYPDGRSYRLRKPVTRIVDPAYGELGDDTEISLRVAPVMIGLGLLEMISEEDIRSREDPEDRDGDGISGRRNLVWDVVAGRPVTGRFGWKAEQPNVRQQVASAFLGDIGITSTLFPHESDSAVQGIDAPSGGEPEVSDEILDFVTFYAKTLAVPAQRSHDDDFVAGGRRLFQEARCTACHVESYTTGADPGFPELSKQKIHPYTDLLLHDMGEGLADDRPTFGASGREWRTPPLWGIGLVYTVNRHTNFLHDGRARSIEEAILWHGGEAAASRDAFKAMNANERRQLLAFLQSL